MKTVEFLGLGIVVILFLIYLFRRWDKSATEYPEDVNEPLLDERIYIGKVVDLDGNNWIVYSDKLPNGDYRLKSQKTGSEIFLNEKEINCISSRYSR